MLWNIVIEPLFVRLFTVLIMMLRLTMNRSIYANKWWKESSLPASPCGFVHKFEWSHLRHNFKGPHQWICNKYNPHYIVANHWLVSSNVTCMWMVFIGFKLSKSPVWSFKDICYIAGLTKIVDNHWSILTWSGTFTGVKLHCNNWHDILINGAKRQQTICTEKIHVLKRST